MMKHRGSWNDCKGGIVPTAEVLQWAKGSARDAWAGAKRETERTAEQERHAKELAAIDAREAESRSLAEAYEKFLTKEFKL